MRMSQGSLNIGPKNMVWYYIFEKYITSVKVTFLWKVKQHGSHAESALSFLFDGNN
jgi:hypothetical protein